MAVLKIARLGSPVLRQIAAPVDPDTIGKRVFQQFLDDMLDTMVETDGIGLAAPQVSRSEQVMVMECKGEHGFPQTILINPVIVGYPQATAES